LKRVMFLSIAISLFLRVALPFKTIFGSGAIIFASSDSYYFADGVRSLTNSQPPFPLPILYIRLLHHFTLISPFGSETDIIIIPMVTHLLTLLAVYLLTKLLFGKPQALIAIIIFSILPGEYMGRSLLGNIDYHVIEVALTTIGMLSIMRFLDMDQSWRIRAAELASGGAIFFLYSQTWNGYLLFISPLALFGLLWLKQKIGNPVVTALMATACAGAALLLAQKVIGISSMTWQTTLEARPLLSGQVPLFSLLSVIIVVVGITWCWLEYRRTKDSKVLLFVIWSAVIMVATLMQRRFDYYLAVNTSIIIGYLICKIAFVLSDNKAKLFIMATTYIICLAMLPVSVRICSEVANAPPADWVEALEWVGENTPEGAVITAWWDYGYWIEYIAERKPVADPGQNDEKIRELAAILTTAIEDEVREVPWLIIDTRTMNKIYTTVEYWAQRRGGDSVVYRLWKGEQIEGIELIYSNDTLKIFKAE